MRKPETKSRVVITLSQAESAHLLQLQAQIVKLQTSLQGALGMVCSQRNIAGEYALSEDCKSLTPVGDPPAAA